MLDKAQLALIEIASCVFRWLDGSRPSCSDYSRVSFMMEELVKAASTDVHLNQSVPWCFISVPLHSWLSAHIKASVWETDSCFSDTVLHKTPSWCSQMNVKRVIERILCVHQYLIKRGVEQRLYVNYNSLFKLIREKKNHFRHTLDICINRHIILWNKKYNVF